MKKRRTAKYRRVSHKEQTIKGFSLQAQDEVLNEYIENNNLVLAGDYEDAGFSASSTDRPALQRLLEDVKLGKIDLIIFTKLDRWFRSVSDYYEIQKILENHDVAWRTVQEDYTTETGDGRFKVNIMLSVAQQELDRDSERIKVVFDSKVKNKQAITGSLPIGYTIGLVDDIKRVIKNKNEEDLVVDFFTHFKIHQSVRSTMKFIADKYDVSIAYDSAMRMLKNKLYIGQYRDVEDYCAPYLTKEDFNKIQYILKNKKQVKRYKNTYLFSGLIRCSNCGSSVSGTTLKDGKRNKIFYYYRCNKAHNQLLCSNKSRLSERNIEKHLLANIEQKLENYIWETEVEDATIKKPKYNKSKIKAEIERLNTMYQKGRIDDEKYDTEYDKLNAKLEMCDSDDIERDLRPLKEFLQSDFKTLYESLTREEKRAMWRSIIHQMIVHDYDNIDVKFL